MGEEEAAARATLAPIRRERKCIMKVGTSGHRDKRELADDDACKSLRIHCDSLCCCGMDTTDHRNEEVRTSCFYVSTLAGMMLISPSPNISEAACTPAYVAIISCKHGSSMTLIYILVARSSYMERLSRIMQGPHKGPCTSI